MFPATTHSDQVDSTSQALAWKGEGFPSWGLHLHYRQAVERQKAPNLPGPVRLKSPETEGTLYTRLGRSVNMSREPLEVSGELAQELINMGWKIVEDG